MMHFPSIRPFPVKRAVRCLLLTWMLVVLHSTALAVGMCVSGSGTCTDAFNGSAGLSLSSYNPAWVKIKGTADVLTTGQGSVAIDSRAYAYYAYSTSTSDVSQITVPAVGASGNYARSACVRMVSGVGGYCVGFGGTANGNYYNCYVEKGGSAIGSGSCGLVPASVSHTLAIVASGSSSVNLDIYVDGVRSGSVTDSNQPLTSPRPGFSLIGDGLGANIQATAWQDSQGSAAMFAEQSVAPAPAFNCASGSGSCYDSFAGTAGKPLTQYNNAWVKAKGTSEAYVTGSKSVQIPGSAYAYYYYSSSTSDTSQITIGASATKQSYSREACVRMQMNVGGYCVSLGPVANGAYNGCYVEKGGLYLGSPNCGTLSANASHTIAITASGIYPVLLQVFVDGVPMRVVTDYSIPYLKARSGFGLLGDGTAANSTAGTWRDYRETVVATAPTFSPGAGVYVGSQGITLSSSTSGAVIHYTLDGTTPTAISPVYAGPLSITSTTTVKAMSMVAGQTQSSTATAQYQIVLPTAATPAFTVPSPYSGGAIPVGIVSSQAGTQMLYCQDTTNTCTPTVPYTSPISFASAGYIRAFSIAFGYLPSNIASWQGSWSAAQIATTSCPEGTQYKVYAGCTIKVTGGLPPYTYSWSTGTDANGLVEGLQLNASTGLVSGTVYGQGVYYVKFTVTDATNSSVSQLVSMPMRADNTLGGCSLFPADSVWHLNIANLPIDNSPAGPIYSAYQNSYLHLVFGPNLADGGIPFLRVPYYQPNVPVTTTVYQSYFTSAPFPSYAPVESTQNAGENGDRHVAILQTAGAGNHCKLWEMWQGAPTANGWTDSSNAYWDLDSYDMLPQDVGSTDAAGLPLTPLLYNYDEVMGSCAPGAECGVVKHAGRLTLNHTLNYHVWPATAQSGTGYCTGGYQDDGRLLSQSNPPAFCSGGTAMGEIFRLKSSVANPVACAGHPQAQVLLTAMRNYGLMLVDNGITGGIVATADSRWNTDDLACLTTIPLSSFEPVDVSSKMIDVNSSRVRP